MRPISGGSQIFAGQLVASAGPRFGPFQPVVETDPESVNTHHARRQIGCQSAREGAWMDGWTRGNVGRNGRGVGNSDCPMPAVLKRPSAMLRRGTLLRHHEER